MIEQSPKKYTCSTCGSVSSKEGHLCSPLDLEKAYTCEFCGNVTADPRHVCKPKLAKLEFVCDSCGRVSIDKGFLCNPRELVWAPKIDLYETEEKFVIEADLPGVMKEDLKLEFGKGTIELHGIRKSREGARHYHLSERMEGSFQRSLVLPDGVETDKIEAKFADGILWISIPKSKEAKTKGGMIPIK